MLILAVCDDESHTLNHFKAKLSEYLIKTNTKGTISCFASAVSLLCSVEYFDIILMDIKMEGMDGMEAVRRLRTRNNRSQVIFVSSSKDFVFQAFDVDAVHYLVKPVSDRELFHALDKAILHCEQTDSQAVTVTKGTLVQVIPFRDILYCEAVNHKIYICTPAEKVDFYGKLDALENQLDDRFFRCHRSYLVNMSYVSSKDKDTVIMTNGDRILLSRRKQLLFSQQLLSFLRSEVL